jgi:hypothetical protein
MAVFIPIVVVVGIVLLLNGLKRLATTERPVDLNPASLEESFVGKGIWVGPYWIAGLNGPFTRLDVYRWGVRIGPGHRLWAWSIPVTDMTWSEMATVKLSRGSTSFQSSSRRKGTVVFSSTPGGKLFGKGPDPRLISALQRHGILVE